MVETRTFDALIAEDDSTPAELRRLPLDALPEGDVLVAVTHSSLNYKDGLAVNGKAKVVRRYPMVPGIDLCGTVEESSGPDWKLGDRVIATGFGMGERHWGGYAQLARVDAGSLVAMPAALTPEQAMGLGTAGLTAMLAVMALEGQGLRPEGGEVVVTGASGGVGSLAVALLVALGYTVVASTGRVETHDCLRGLGATEIIGRDVLGTPSPRPLESVRWSGAIDTVGGETLAGLLRTTAPGGAIASCGNASGNELHTTVLPFILRGVALLGIDSNFCPRERRIESWCRLAEQFPLPLLARIVRVAPLSQVPTLSQEILQGHIQGRVAIDVR